jgi:hypothetical protein
MCFTPYEELILQHRDRRNPTREKLGNLDLEEIAAAKARTDKESKHAALTAPKPPSACACTEALKGQVISGELAGQEQATLGASSMRLCRAA